MTATFPLIPNRDHEPRYTYRDEPCQRFASHDHQRNADDQDYQSDVQHNGSVTHGP